MLVVVLVVVVYCRSDLVKLSISRHPGRPDVTGLSLVFVAAEAGAEEVCRLLLSKFRLSADQPADNGFTPVFTAAQFGQNKTLAVLAEFGADFTRKFLKDISRGPIRLYY